MALKGTLKDFSVGDIFQLIGQQGKSGSLYVRTKEKEAHIVFDNGKVVLGTFRKSDEDFLLGTMLLRANVITSEQLAKAIETQKKTLRSLGDILKSEGLITSATLGEFVALQLKEVLFRLFQWKSGFYEFVAEKIQYNKSIIKPQTAEGVLMDGFRMLDEWPLISEKVGSIDGVFASKVSTSDLEAVAPDDTFDVDFDAAFGDEPTPPKEPEESKKAPKGFSEEEKKTLDCLDGKRPLREVIYLTRMGTFETLKCISTMLDRGAIEKVNELLPTRVGESDQEFGQETIFQWMLKSYRPLLAVLILSLFLPVAAFGIRSNWSNRYALSGATKISLEDLRILRERFALIQQLDLYRLQTGNYPNLLEELQKPSLSLPWEYQRNGDSYVLNRRVKSK